MGDLVWYSISESFRDGLLELFILHLVKMGPSQTAKEEELVKTIAEKTGLWFTERQIYAVLRRLEKHGMLNRINLTKIYEITVHGKEEIDDRISQMQRFIGYILPKGVS